MKKIRLSTQGFTLIELLVVIAIIGILTAVISASFSEAKKNSRDGKRISDLAQLQLGLEGFYDACKTYPTTNLSGSYLTPSSSASGCTNTILDFVSSLPGYPVTTQYTYVYEPQSSNKSYCLGATLENSSNSAKKDECSMNAGNGTTNHRVKP
jgi:prepilin-type N-terminal cleavage/methylation domain-containing protein